MPEGDTVFATAAVLREALLDKTLTRCDVRVPKFAAVDLSGERVDEVVTRGKHLFIRVGAASIHSHLMMDGSWQVGRVRGPAHRIRIILTADGRTASGVDLGLLEIIDRATDLDSVAHLGPDLLGADWSAARAAANLTADPDRPLVETLLDQTVMAGLGNVYANELCFVFGQSPARSVGDVADPLCVVTRAQQMLWANRFRRHRTTTGNTGRGRELWVYGRAGLPCRRCGTLIATGHSGERVTFWCPFCQR